ncbi:hypothetical protein PYW07_000367 [Mythimna separata]|uniref:Uncharacterized protein n=1 Tax=Mythimna separata TaxID=271217 RepID=A0AAD8E0H2_MYTSE|nr:hypothetical protein PYW07_000367 [Mythimna separata]
MFACGVRRGVCLQMLVNIERESERCSVRDLVGFCTGPRVRFPHGKDVSWDRKGPKGNRTTEPPITSCHKILSLAQAGRQIIFLNIQKTQPSNRSSQYALEDYIK